MRAFREAAAALEVELRLIAIASDPLCAGFHRADLSRIVPTVESPAYLPVVAELCATERVDVVLPTLDEELALWAALAWGREHAGELPIAFGPAGSPAAVGAVRVIISPLEAVNACLDKLALAAALERLRIPTASTAIFDPTAVTRFATPPIGYPFIIKPRRGKGSLGVFRVWSEADLDYFANTAMPRLLSSGIGRAGFICQEMLKGQEFTLDVLCDLITGEPLSVVPRLRLTVRAGVSDTGRTVRDQRLVEIGATTARSLGIIGPANIQGFVRDDGRIALTEVNPRFSGGIPLTIAAGGDFPRWLLQMLRSEQLAPRLGVYEGVTMVRYEESLFVSNTEE